MANNSGLRTNASCASRARVKERKEEEAAAEKRLEEEKAKHEADELTKREKERKEERRTGEETAAATTAVAAACPVMEQEGGKDAFGRTMATNSGPRTNASCVSRARAKERKEEEAVAEKLPVEWKSTNEDKELNQNKNAQTEEQRAEEGNVAPATAAAAVRP